MRKFSTLFLASLYFAAGCAPAVGDACETSLQCPAGAICDTSVPDGYCIATNCQLNSDCPEDSVCVEFDRYESFCMLACSSNGDCRSGYTCRPCEDGILCGGEASGGFCYVELPEGEVPYTRASSDSSSP